MALNETPSSLSDYLLSNTTCDSSLNLLFCNEQVPFLPQRRLEFVDENMAKSTRHLGEGAFALTVTVYVLILF